MGVEIWLEDNSHPGMDASGLSAGISQGISAKEFGALKVLVGCKRGRASDVFRISETKDQCGRVECRGDWSRVDNVAAGLTTGVVEVHSSVGIGACRGMRGGSCHVFGNAGDCLGESMSGGNILVDGNAGARAGGPAAGATSGLNRGSIVVRGNCGRYAGMRMRRGTLAVGGDCGELAGYEMRGGNLIIGGRAGELAGQGMRRGTIVLLTPPQAMDDGMRSTGTFANSFHRMLGRTMEWSCLNSTRRWPDQFEIWAGDWLYGSKGEIVVACVTPNIQARNASE